MFAAVYRVVMRCTMAPDEIDAVSLRLFLQEALRANHAEIEQGVCELLTRTCAPISSYNPRQTTA